MSDQDDRGGGGQAGFSLKRLLPLVILALGLVAFFALDLDSYASCAALGEHRQFLLDYVAQNRVLASLIFLGVYTLAVAFSLPGGAILSITGGFLFGAVLGTLFVLVAATIGATALYLIAKTALGDTLRAKAGPWMAKMADGFQENAFSYLLVLRLVPLFPFWLVNLVPALLGVNLGTFVVATFIGIVPGTIVFVWFGQALGSIFDAGGECSLSGILTPQVIVALVGLAVLALIPVVYKKIKAPRDGG